MTPADKVAAVRELRALLKPYGVEPETTKFVVGVDDVIGIGLVRAKAARGHFTRTGRDGRAQRGLVTMVRVPTGEWAIPERGPDWEDWADEACERFDDRCAIARTMVGPEPLDA